VFEALKTIGRAEGKSSGDKALIHIASPMTGLYQVLVLVGARAF
jgi:hypothetical protein